MFLAASVRLESMFNKEVPMSTTARRTRRPAFESLEGKILLSTGMADPALAVHRAKVQRFSLNGTLKGIPFGTIQQAGIFVTAFFVTGSPRSMGKVSGSLNLADPLLSPG